MGVVRRKFANVDIFEIYSYFTRTAMKIVAISRAYKLQKHVFLFHAICCGFFIYVD